MTRRRKVVFAIVAMGLSLVSSLGVLLAADLYAHRKFQESGALNIWGYRGPTVGRKQPGERRIVVVGESTAFGYGVRWHEAIPALLERLLNQPEDAVALPHKVSVVNLAYNNEGAHSFRYTLADYAYLDYDVALFYTGYNDLPYFSNFQASNLQVFRHQSLVFRWTGYFPMLPVVLREKAMSIRYDGRLEDAYLGKKTVFRPSLAQRSTASVLDAAARVTSMFDQQWADSTREWMKVRDGKVVLADPAATECERYTGYCDELYQAVTFVLDRGKRVLMVTQPYLTPDHRDQQRLMGAYLRKRFPDPARLRFGNAGNSVDRHDPALSFDGLHLTAAGSLQVARDLVDTVRDSLR